MKEQTLGDVDDTLVNTGDFLNEIVSDPQKYRCLKTFGECQDLMAWLQEFTTSNSKIIFVAINSRTIIYSFSFRCK